MVVDAVSDVMVGSSLSTTWPAAHSHGLSLLGWLLLLCMLCAYMVRDQGLNHSQDGRHTVTTDFCDASVTSQLHEGESPRLDGIQLGSSL